MDSQDSNYSAVSDLGVTMLARRILVALVAAIAALALVVSVSSSARVAQAASSSGSTYMAPERAGTLAATPTPWLPPLPSTPVVDDGPVVVYEVWGGRVQPRLHLLMTGDGTIDFSLGGVTDEDPDGIAELYHTISLARAARFFELDSEYGTPGVEGDIQDSITIRQHGRSKTVLVHELGGKGVTPQGLMDIVASLRRVAVGHWEYPQRSDNPAPFPFPAFPAADPGSPAYTVTFELAGFGFDAIVQIEQDGRVTFNSGDYWYTRYYGQSVGSTGYLSPTLLSQLTSEIDAANFFQLDEQNILPPPTPGGETKQFPTDLTDYITTITQGGRSNSISTIEMHDYVPAVESLVYTLQEISGARLTGGTDHNGRGDLISARVSTCADEGWSMDIDVNGNVFLSDVYVGRLSPAELHDVTDLFLRNGWSELKDEYRAAVPPKCSSTQESYIEYGASVSFQWRGNLKEVQAEEGAVVPRAVDIVLTRLASIYSRFVLAHNSDIDILPGMPRTGNASPVDLTWPILLLALSSIGVGFSLRFFSVTQWTPSPPRITMKGYGAKQHPPTVHPAPARRRPGQPWA